MGKGKGMMDRRRHQSNPIQSNPRRGIRSVTSSSSSSLSLSLSLSLIRISASTQATLLLAAAVASWILFHAASGYNYTAVSLAADVLLLLLAVLYAWSRAARLLGRPAPPIPDLHPAADQLAALIHSGLALLASAFRRVAQGQPGSGRVFAWLAAAALLGRLARDLPTLCYAVIVGALTIPALYQRFSVERYARLASLNLYRYELFYQSFSLTCYLRARDYLIELLKEP